MEEEMVHSFLIPMAHITPIHQNTPPKDLPINRSPRKKCHPLRDLSFPNTLPRKVGDSYTHVMVIGPGIKLAIPIETPMRSVTPKA